MYKKLLFFGWTALILSAIQSIPRETRAEMSDKNIQTAVFAGGCFWCMEAPFDKLDGVIQTTSGYTGGQKEKPSYKEVSSGSTGHLEAIKISYNPKKVSYEQLLYVFWKQINPTDASGQFVDRGKQYRSAIFYATETEKKLAIESKKKLESLQIFSKPIVTEILASTKFYPAEKYHQDYYKINPLRYKFYRYNSGRDKFLHSVWKGKENLFSLKKKTRESNKYESYKKPTEQELKNTLTVEEYQVTQKGATERPFKNKYWDNKEAGIYVDIVSGEPLFSSLDKYDSKTGWPSFTRVLVKEHIVEKKDYKLLFKRIELRSKYANSHLGHVFTDGPPPTNLRYCINSAALRFIPVNKLKEEGYAKYLPLFNIKAKSSEIEKGKNL